MRNYRPGYYCGPSPVVCRLISKSSVPIRSASCESSALIRSRFTSSASMIDDTRATVDFEDNMLALMHTRALLFDDGARAVIDLAERRPPGETRANP